MSDLILPWDELVDGLRSVFLAKGCAPTVADALALNCAAATRDGSKSHGLFRMAGYVSTLKSGWVDRRAEPIVEDVAPGMLRVDARNGFTVPAHAAARTLLMRKAKTNGIAILAIRNSHHLGALYLDIEPYADAGFLALSVINSMAVVVHPGGRRPVYGTNPVAFAAPRAGDAPLIFDMATSTMAHGDVRVAAGEGASVPAGVGVDAQGTPTTDPRAILDGGALLPFGGHKGAAIALMVELLCAALVGGQFSFEVDWSGHPGAQTPRTGQTIILIDPSHGGPAQAPFAARAEALIQTILASGPVRLPGAKRQACRRAAAADGIRVDADEWQAVLALKDGA